MRKRHTGSRRHPLLIGATLVVLLAPVRSQGAVEGPPYPRLANIYLHGAVDATQIPALARWDVLVLDSVWSNSQLQQLRQRNPDIKLFFYVCAYCMAVDPVPTDVWRRYNYDYARNNDLWWRNADHSIASDWPKTQLLNMTDRAPAGPEGPWRTWMAKRIDALVAGQPQLDGVFLDNFWKSISWEQGHAIRVDSDCNPSHNPGGCNGVPDPPAVLDSLWNSALRNFARDVRGRFDVLQMRRGLPRPLAIVTNGATDYYPWINGTMHERFPSRQTPPDVGNPYGYNWNFEMQQYPVGYLVAPFRRTPYNVQILNASWKGDWNAPQRSADFERHKRFTLVSALLGDGYYSLDAASGHGSLWWEPEFDGGGLGKGYLGYPKGSARRIGVATGPELMVNGGFAGSTLAWSTQAQSCVAVYRLDSSVLRSSPACARIDISSVAPGGSFKMEQSVPLLGGVGYTLSFWARSSVPQEILVHINSDNCRNGRCLDDQHFPLANVWEQHVVSFVSSGNAQASLGFFITTPGTVWLDDVSLRMGDSAVFRRDFDRGIVLLNYTKTTQTVSLGRTFYRLQVPGSSVWNGAAITSETIPPSDARILLVSPRPTDTPTPDLPPASTPRGQLLRSSPNPVAPTGTSIRFSLARDEHVRLVVYDVAGRRVRVLLDEPMRAGGELAVPWDATDDAGRRVPPGIYVCRIETPTFTQSQKLAVAAL